jgi:hypothetical protein
MKTLSIFLLVIGWKSILYGQSKSNVFADVACSSLGSSVTYDRALSKHISLGLGTSLYDFNGDDYHNVRCSAYIDGRPYWIIKRNLLFTIADIGMQFYSGRQPNPAKDVIGPNGALTGLGVGYGYRINKRGLAPYISFVANGSFNHYIIRDPQEPQADYELFDVEFVISIGLKF